MEVVKLERDVWIGYKISFKVVRIDVLIDCI